MSALLYGVLSLISGIVVIYLINKYPIKQRDIFKRTQEGYVGALGLIILGLALLLKWLKGVI